MNLLVVAVLGMFLQGQMEGLENVQRDRLCAES